MARPKDPQFIEEMPPRKALTDVRTALDVYSQGEMVKLMLKELDHSIKVHDKDLAALIREQEQSTLNGVTRPPPPPKSLKAIEVEMTDVSKMLEKLLGKAGRAEKVAKAHSEHSGVTAIATALIEIGNSVEAANKAIHGMVSLLKQELAAHQKLEARLADGGHPQFGDHIVKSAKQIWLTLDAAYDVLGIQVRNANVPYDKVLASRPTTKTSLRFANSLIDPALKSKPKKVATKPAAKKQTPGTAKRNQNSTSTGATSADLQQSGTATTSADGHGESNESIKPAVVSISELAAAKD